MKETVLYLVVGILIVAAIAWGAVHLLAPTPATVGDAVPNLVLTEHGGQSRELSSFRGHAVLLFVMRTDCEICLRQMSALRRLHRAFGERGLDVVLVVTDLAPEAADSILPNYEGAFTVLDDPGGRDVKKALGIDAAALPTAYLIDPTGAVVQKYEGFVNWGSREVEHFIAKVLPPPATPAPEDAAS